jgi:CRP/FNR family transcriptional regulator, cyclic AMP receptor protein
MRQNHAVALLDALTGLQRQRLLASARLRRFARNEVLFHEGDPADSLHVITRGRVAVRVSSESGARVTVDVLGRDDILGELALLTPNGTRAATAVALELTETMVVTAAQFSALRAEHSSVEEGLISILVERNRRQSARLVEALTVSAERRVLRRLLDLTLVYANEDPDVVVPLTQDDLAGMAGTTRETVNRALRREVDRGSLTLGRGKVTVLDVAGLTKRAQ